MPVRDPQEQAELYANWVRKTGMAENSKRVYRARVDEFIGWLVAQGDEYARALEDEDVRDYAAVDFRRKLLTVDRKAPATVSQYMSALGSFFEWVGLGKPRNVSVEVPAGGKESLDEADLRRVLRAAKSRGARDYAIVSLLANGGLRVSELVGVEMGDLFLQERGGYILVRRGKGGRIRTVELGPTTRAALREWRAHRATVSGADTSPLFLSRTGRRLSVRSVQDLVAAVGAEAGVQLHPHKLRHTMARRHLQEGGDIVVLSQILGHKDIRTTAIYGKPGKADFVRAAEAVELEI